MGYDFNSTITVRSTRKPHTCAHCRTSIDIGEPAVVSKGTYDNAFYCVYMHPDCNEAGLAHVHITGSWGDDWIWLHEMEKEDLDYLLKDHPHAIARLRRNIKP